LDAAAILTVLIGAAGLLLSLGLLLFPERIRQLNSFFSRSYRVKEHLAYFDRTMPDTLFVYRRPAVYGALLSVGSGALLVFLLFQLNIDRLLAALNPHETERLLWEMALTAMMMAGKVTGVIGLLLGMGLIIAPARVQRIERRLNTWIGTQSLVDRLDDDNDAFDGFALRHPVLTGTIGVLLSAVLIFLSIFSFF
jgi:hypothetical protein